MSERLPRVTADEVIKVLSKAGFLQTRQSGSHKIYKNSIGRRVTIPYHKAKVLHPKLLATILQNADLTTEGFIKLLR